MKQVTAVVVPRRRLVRRSAQQWRALIQAQAGSGMSIAAICRAAGRVRRFDGQLAQTGARWEWPAGSAGAVTAGPRPTGSADACARRRGDRTVHIGVASERIDSGRVRRWRHSTSARVVPQSRWRTPHDRRLDSPFRSSFAERRQRPAPGSGTDPAGHRQRARDRPTFRFDRNRRLSFPRAGVAGDGRGLQSARQPVEQSAVHYRSMLPASQLPGVAASAVA